MVGLQPFESEVGKSFRSIVKGKNFMTPEILGYIKIKNGSIEISKGEFMDIKLWGVTVVMDDEKVDALCKSFNLEEDLEYYISNFEKS